MYFYIKNVIFITICLNISFVYPQFNIKQQTADLQSDNYEFKNRPTLDFLLKERDSPISGIFNINNEKAVDILKAAANSTQNNIIYEDLKEIYVELQEENHSSLIVTTTLATATTTEPALTSEDENISLQSPFLTDTALNVLDFISNNNNNAIDILKAAERFKKEIGIKYSDIPNTTKTSYANFAATTETLPATASSHEIILSELSNFPNSEGDHVLIGQKIVYQHSNVGVEAAETSSVGAEILKNVTKTCGSQFGKRISFANETTLMEFPWTALLLYNTKIRYHCGGSLITGKYVLTAAHCVAQQFYELIGVRLGEHDISEPVDCAPDLAGDTICAHTVDVDVVKIIVHHDYSHLSFKNDIALLRLDKDYVSRSYYPICIPTPEMTYDDTQAIVAGWGATEKAIRSTVLLKATIPIHDMSKCREIYRNSVFNDSTEICGSGANEVDVCKGDSGGALFTSRTIKTKDKFYQMGIIALGVRRCGDERFLPAVFTKLSAFYKWIENNLEY